MVLIRRLVLKQLDAGPVAGANHPDLVDDRTRIDVHELLHEVAGRVAEGPERQRVDAAEHGLQVIEDSAQAVVRKLEELGLVGVPA